MKKLLYSVIALLAVACNPKSSSDSKSSSDTQEKKMSLLTSTSSSLYAVPLQVAVANIKHYHKNIRTYDSLIAAASGKKPDPKIPLKAFTVRAADLFEAMGMPVADTAKATYNYIRVYLAMSEKDDNFKLYLTPVSGANLNANPPVAGNDVILTGQFFGLSSSDGYVLDFTNPCPTTCPTGSPLN